jgi:hypothetical protein
MSHQQNLLRIAVVAKALAELNKDVVFVGGAVVSLYSQKPHLIDLRVTDDIDVIIEIANRGKYILLQERLRTLGFAEDTESNIICRWKVQGIVVDIMPNDDSILGFSNPWYNEGYQNRIKITVSDQEIQIFTAPYFIASKIIALNSRMDGDQLFDWRWSRDFEDIMKIISEIDMFDESTFMSDEVKLFIREAFDSFRKDLNFLEEAISANLRPPFYTDRDIERIIDKIILIADEL